MATSSVNSVGSDSISSSLYSSSLHQAAGSTDVSDQFMMLLLAQLKNQNPARTNGRQLNCLTR